MAWYKDRKLTPEIVHRILAASFPERKFGRICYFSEGWDNETYEAGEKWLFRFPKRKETAGRLLKELRLLPLFSDKLNLKVPEFSLIGQPSILFPYSFAGYRKIEGIQAFSSNPDLVNRCQAAKALGRFLSGLHSFPLRSARQHGATKFKKWDEKKELKCLLGTSGRIRKILGPNLFAKIRERFKKPPLPVPRGPICLIHADLMVEHILLSKDGRKVVGVIDWADMDIGPAASDFVFAAAWLGKNFLKDVLKHHKGPDLRGQIPWMLQRGLIVGLTNIFYGSSTGKKEYIRDGVRTMKNILS